MRREPTFAKVLPNGYRELQYIQSTGTQYIDTGVRPDNNTTVECDAKFTDINSYSDSSGQLFFVRWTGSPTYYSFGISDAAGYDCFIYYYAGTNIGGPITRNGNSLDYAMKRYIYRLDMTAHKASARENPEGTVDSANITQSTFQSTYSMPLFAFANMGAVAICGKAKMWYCKIWDGTDLIRDYIPALRLSDNKPGLYDMVNDIFYTNQGTGEFLYE